MRDTIAGLQEAFSVVPEAQIANEENLGWGDRPPLAEERLRFANGCVVVFTISSRDSRVRPRDCFVNKHKPGSIRPPTIQHLSLAVKQEDADLPLEENSMLHCSIQPAMF